MPKLDGKLSSEHPYVVVTTDLLTPTAGYTTREEADADVARRNRDAEALKVSCRYMVLGDK